MTTSWSIISDAKSMDRHRNFIELIRNKRKMFIEKNASENDTGNRNTGPIQHHSKVRLLLRQ